VNPLAVRAMAEVGIDISAQRSKTLERFVDEPWDYVVTVCDSAHEACPLFPRATARMHWSFDDPSSARGSDEERLAVFRRVRDEIKARLATCLQHRRTATLSQAQYPGLSTIVEGRLPKGHISP
jgi:arsenate reductase